MGTLPFCIVRAFLGCKATTPTTICAFGGELISSWTLGEEGALQQKVSLYAKWFHWILSEFIGLVNGDQWTTPTFCSSGGVLIVFLL
jgi:hypothetical protein